MDESNETATETTTAQTVGNFVVFGFAIIGAVQTTKFAVVKTRQAIRAIKSTHVIVETPSES